VCCSPLRGTARWYSACCGSAAARRYASLASLIACAAVPIYFWIVGAPHGAGLFFLLTVLDRHHAPRQHRAA